jgi:hypothetical protein
MAEQKDKRIASAVPESSGGVSELTNSTQKLKFRTYTFRLAKCISKYVQTRLGTQEIRIQRFLTHNVLQLKKTWKRGSFQQSADMANPVFGYRLFRELEPLQPKGKFFALNIKNQPFT